MTIKRQYRLHLAVGAVLLSTACQSQPPRFVTHELRTSRDSVLHTAVQLGRYVHLIDDAARLRGSLPTDIHTVAQNFDWLSSNDVWGRELRYDPQGLRYELRSAGPDGAFGTEDDIVVLGQLGRILPCESRHQFGTLRFENSAPPCDDGPIVLIPRCSELRWQRPIELDGATAADSVSATGRLLVYHARHLDGHGRDMGALPLSLQQVVSNRVLTDFWGKPLQYIRAESTFTLASAGRDGEFGTFDDVRVTGVLGHTIPCAFYHGQELVRCDDPPPVCHDGRIEVQGRDAASRSRSTVLGIIGWQECRKRD
jgi:hypothetical protein